MKKIEAIVRKSKFPEVKVALHKVGVNFFSYWTVNGVNNEINYDSLNPPAADGKDTTNKQYISILVNDDFEEVTIKAILESAFTGHTGDGRIFISNIEEILKIKTKEKGPKTLR